uniref:Thioredoxin domain-containing protein n=1 Tax=Dunaliella tertiolecta TaxID=3047 RepID=A0A7S3R9L6_DUNTE
MMMRNPSCCLQISDGRIHFIKFYLPRQGESQRLAPLWKDLAAHHHVAGDDRIAVSIVDCSDEENIDLCKNMSSFPLFKIFTKGTDQGTYKGALDLDTMRNYVLGAAHFYQPIKGNWFMEKIRAYFKFLRQAYSAKPHRPDHAHRRRTKHDEF